MLVADMDRAIAVERHAGRLHQDLHQAAINPAGLVFEDLAVDVIIAGAERGQNGVARFIQLSGGDDDLALIAWGACHRGGGLRQNGGGAKRDAGHTEQEQVTHTGTP